MIVETLQPPIKASPTAVSLYPEQIQIIQNYANHTGLRNFSAALRMIITEWAREHNGQNEPQAETA